MAIENNPLTEADLASINTALEQGKTAQQQIDLAKQAGIDVATQESTLNGYLTKLRSIKQVYFPGQ